MRRTFAIVPSFPKGDVAVPGTESKDGATATAADDGAGTVLRTEYRAKTNRMLRVAVNGFMESLGVVLGVMERLDVDVLPKKA